MHVQQANLQGVCLFLKSSTAAQMPDTVRLNQLRSPSKFQTCTEKPFPKMSFFFFFNSVRRASFFYKLKYIYTVLDKYTVGNCTFFSVHLCLPTAYYY